MYRHPHRLRQDDYTGRHQYFLTICCFQRRRYFSDPQIADLVRMTFLQTATAESFAVLAYCLMPDHLHAVVEGRAEQADLARFVRVAKQRAGYAFVHLRAGKLWQQSYFDRTIRREESLGAVIAYVINNPVRAGMVAAPLDYPHWGSGVCSREEILDFIAANGPPGV